MENASVLLTHDPIGDIAYLYLRPQTSRDEIARSDIAGVETPEASLIVLNFDDYDRLLSVKMLGASKLLPPELLEHRPGGRLE
jgi:hypothetical protein